MLHLAVCKLDFLNTGAAPQGICSETGGQFWGTLLRNIWGAILAGSLFLPASRSENYLDSLSINDDDGAVQLGPGAKVCVTYHTSRKMPPSAADSVRLQAVPFGTKEIGLRRRGGASGCRVFVAYHRTVLLSTGVFGVSSSGRPYCI